MVVRKQQENWSSNHRPQRTLAIAHPNSNSSCSSIPTQSGSVLISTQLSFLRDLIRFLGYGLEQPPSEPDHLQAWRFGIPSVVVSRLGTYLAGPDRRVARDSDEDVSLTNLLSTGNSVFERNFWVVSQNQVPTYDEDQYHPLAGTAAFIPARAPHQLDEPRDGRPLIPDGYPCLQAPNPHNQDEQSGPGPGPDTNGEGS